MVSKYRESTDDRHSGPSSGRCRRILSPRHTEPHLQQPHKSGNVARSLPEERAEQGREDGHVAGGQRGRPRLYQLREDLEHVRVELLHVLLHQGMERVQGL